MCAAPNASPAPNAELEQPKRNKKSVWNIELFD